MRWRPLVFDVASHPSPRPCRGQAACWRLHTSGSVCTPLACPHLVTAELTWSLKPLNYARHVGTGVCVSFPRGRPSLQTSQLPESRVKDLGSSRPVEGEEAIPERLRHPPSGQQDWYIQERLGQEGLFPETRKARLPSRLAEAAVVGGREQRKRQCGVAEAQGHI